jgi:GNAT superfamily N-acetyltransferase
MLEIIPYESKYQPDFKRMNLEWLDTYGLTESHDLEILDHPEENVLAKDGKIFLAKEGEKIMASAGIARAGGDVFELVKMYVDPAYRGRGISKKLLSLCIEHARKAKATKLILFSNSRLTTALSLYAKYGFKHVEVTGTPLVTADVKMELSL